jgi:hypothetical protein
MFSTPWYGMPCAVDDLPVERVFVLHQGMRNELRQLSPSQAATQLYARSFPPYWIPDGIGSLLSQIGDMCAAVPVYELAFVPDLSVVDLLQDLISG